MLYQAINWIHDVLPILIRELLPSGVSLNCRKRI